MVRLVSVLCKDDHSYLTVLLCRCKELHDQYTPSCAPPILCENVWATVDPLCIHL